MVRPRSGLAFRQGSVAPAARRLGEADAPDAPGLWHNGADRRERPMHTFHLSVRDFRALAQVEWSPHGVCLLCGPNGSGKTTLLSALRFLRTLFNQGHEAAFHALDGVDFRRDDAPPEAPVEFTVQVDDISWKLRFPMSARGLKGTYGEELTRGGKPVLRAAMFQDAWYLGTEQRSLDERRTCARVLWDAGQADWLEPLARVLDGARVYETYWLNQIKDVRPATGTDVYLHWSGRNLWTVLQNWKAAPRRYNNQFEWVLDHARRAFPGILDTIEFDRGLPMLFAPGSDQGHLPNRAADGLLTGLLHLTAVAGAKPGSIIAFDEMENQLHPHAIRSLVASMRERAEAHDQTMVLTTHSPVVINEFKDREDQIYVLERGWDGPLPVRLDELHDPAWLSHFVLGDLYEREQFAAPRVAAGE